VADAPWQPLSGGRSNWLWRVGDLVVKCYDQTAASPLFPNDALAEARALAAFAPLGLAPALVGAGADWVIYRHLQGAMWAGDPAPVAGLLHRLHGADVPPALFRPLPNGSAALLAQARAMADGLDLPPPPADPQIAPVTPRPVHADAVAGNVIISPDGARLIDWQCPGMGDPAEDLAAFLSPAMQWLYTGRTLTPAQRAAFLRAYPDRMTVDRFLALEALFRWRMAAHCAWKAKRGDPDYAAALRLEL
jgi:hypothetical protein